MFSSKDIFFGSQASGYRISNSLRFRSSASAYLSRTFGTPTSATTFTFSFWVKRGYLGTAYQYLFASGTAYNSAFFGINFNSDNLNVTSGNVNFVYTAAVFRDPSAWYHCVVAIDTTQGDGSNRIRVYVNGILQTLTTANTVSQGATFDWNASGKLGNICREPVGLTYADTYLADVVFVDGYPTVGGTTYNATTWAALNVATLFGANDATTGIWNPKTYSGSGYGNNGFYLQFSDTSSPTNVLTGNVGLGKDFSGNGNYWTTNNISLAGSTVTSFTSTGTTSWTAPSGVTSVRYLVVAGGGGGGGATTNNQGASGAGGGGGGVLTGTLTVIPGNSYTVTVGAGGSAGAAGPTSGTQGGSGGNSVFDSITATGGGGGGAGHFQTPAPAAGSGANGGSGGGQGGSSSSTNATFGTGTSGQGNNGGANSNARTGSGGGGAGAVGANAASNTQAGNGGAGIASTISGSTVTYGGGGGGGAWYSPSTAGTGGSGGGGAGSSSSAAGTAGTANTGGGGGGGYSDLTNAYAAGAGGSGIVVLTYGSGVTYDSMIDSPTNYADGSTGRGNYTILNPLTNYASGTLTNANLLFNDATGSWKTVAGSMFVSSGKWYFEVTLAASVAGSSAMYGVVSTSFAVSSYSSYIGASASGWALQSTAAGGTGKWNSGSSTGLDAVAQVVGDVYQIAFDVDAGKIWFGKNNTWYGSGNPATGANAAYTNLTGSIAAAVSSASATCSLNCGQMPFSYTPPSGFSALNTQNLSTPTILNGAQYMAAVTYAGNNASPRSIAISSSNSGNNPLGTTFQPDFVWVKNRSNTNWHNLVDVARGAAKTLFSNSTTGETTNDAVGYVSAFNNDGFSVTTGSSSYDNVNTTGYSYVGWLWNAGGAPTVDNTAGVNAVPTAGSVKINGSNSTATLAGSIAATRISANTSAGFSVVTYTGNGSSPATVDHGLGVAPDWIIVKARGISQNWESYHSVLGNTKYMEGLNTTAAAVTSTIWNNTSPTSSVFTVNGADVNTNARQYVVYCFAAVAGYSAFGSYTGNGSADGPFIYTGFRPRYVLVKGSTFASNWNLFDTSRNLYNVTGQILRPNSDASEFDGNATTGGSIDILSNGFKIRKSDADCNSSGQTFIYAAFAENPFKISRAR